MWWKLRRHRLAVVSGVVLLLLYGSILVSEILAPYNQETRDIDHIYAPTQQVHLFHEGSFVGPFVSGYSSSLDIRTMQRVHVADESKVQTNRFLCLGDSSGSWGPVPAPS